jgi:hypothetical protein
MGCGKADRNNKIEKVQSAEALAIVHNLLPERGAVLAHLQGEHSSPSDLEDKALDHGKEIHPLLLGGETADHLSCG